MTKERRETLPLLATKRPSRRKMTAMLDVDAQDHTVPTDQAVAIDVMVREIEAVTDLVSRGQDPTREIAT